MPVHDGRRLLIFEQGSNIPVNHITNICEQAYYAYLLPCLPDNHIRFHKLLERSSGKIIIGTYHRHFQTAQSPGKLIHPVVELMIAKTCGIKLHCIKQRNLYVTVKLGKIRCPLPEITSMQKQDIPLAGLIPYLTYIRSLLYHSSESCLLAGALSLDMAMGIVNMKHRQLLSRDRQGKQH